MSPLTTYLVETFVTLLAVVAVAIAVLFGAKRLGVGRPHGPMRLLGRMPLDARRVVYLVRVGEQILILGASEAGLSKLGELEPRELDEGESPAPVTSFTDILARLRGGSTGSRREGAAPRVPKGSDHDG